MKIRSLLIFLIMLLQSNEVYSDEIASPETPESTFLILELNDENSLLIAINSSYDLKEIKAQRQISQLLIREYYRALYPSLSLEYNQTEEVNQRELDAKNFQIKLSSDIILYDGGQSKMQYNIAKQKAIIARNDYQIALNQLTSQIRSEFFNLLLQKESIEVYERTLEKALIQEKFIKKELQLGEVTKNDVLEIEIKVKELQNNLVSLRKNYGLSQNKFKAMLKIKRKQPIKINGDISNDFTIYRLSDEHNVESLISIALKKRKEIESKVLESKIALQDFQMKKYYYIPKVSVSAYYMLSDDEFVPHDKEWGLSFKIASSLWGNSYSTSQSISNSENNNSKTYGSNNSINLQDNMNYKRDIYESKIALNKAVIDLESTFNQIELEIEDLYNTLESSWNSIEISKNRLQLQEQNLKIEEYKIGLGETRRIDYLEKQIEFTETEISLLKSITEYIVAGENLELALNLDNGTLNISKKNSKEKNQP